MRRFIFLKKIWVAAAIFAVSLSTYGQQTQIGKILGLSVSGNKTSDASVIKLSSGLHENQNVKWEEIQQAVKQLWALGIYSDIRIIVDKQLTSGIYLSIQVEEYPRLEKVEIEGNKKIKKEDIRKEAGFFRGQVITSIQVSEAKKRLYKMYSEKGYTLALIEAKNLETVKEKRIILLLNIREGEKVQIKKIQFFGNEVFDDGRLRKQMKKTKEDRWWRGADFDKEEYEEDKEKILMFCRNQGYRDAIIVRDSLYYDVSQTDMFIDIWVNEGKCYHIGKITWEGNELLPVEHLESLMELDEGDVFSQEKFDKSIHEKIHGAYFDRGYIYSQINPRETLRGGDTLDIHFVVNENEPVIIRNVSIAGNTRTKDRVIRRNVRIRPGDIFSKELLMRSHRELMMLNYFTIVEPNYIPFSEKEMNLSFKVEEKSTDTANLSIGWSELDRLIGSVGLGMNNLFGNGQQFSLNWNFGRFYRSMNISFTEPWFLNTPTLVGFTFRDIKRDPFYIGYSQRTRGISLRLGRRFSWPDNYFRGDWIYRLEETELADFSDYYIQYNYNNIVNEDWPLTTSGITQIISRNSLDHPEFPTTGSRVSLQTEIAGGPLGGNVGYHKHIFSAEFFFPTLTSRLVFLSRAKLGYMNTLGKSGRIPYLEYFFIGGTGMSPAIPLRGYDDPLAGGGIRQGGRTMLQTTIELRFPVISSPMAFGLIFAEAGNTWLDIEDTDPFDLRRSVGVGARIFMPMVGVLGFDYSYAFDHLEDGRRVGMWKPQFVFGKSF